MQSDEKPPHWKPALIVVTTAATRTICLHTSRQNQQRLRGCKQPAQPQGSSGVAERPRRSPPGGRVQPSSAMGKGSAGHPQPLRWQHPPVVLLKAILTAGTGSKTFVDNNALHLDGPQLVLIAGEGCLWLPCCSRCSFCWFILVFSAFSQGMGTSLPSTRCCSWVPELSPQRTGKQSKKERKETWESWFLPPPELRIGSLFCRFALQEPSQPPIAFSPQGGGVSSVLAVGRVGFNHAHQCV